MEINEVIERFRNLKVLIIGDAILDMYIKGVSERLCREAPVPVIDVKDYELDCGGAANTAINVAALGAETYFLTVIGEDENGHDLTKALKSKKVNTLGIIKDSARKTIAKKRIVASSNILLRIDEGNIDPISEGTQAKLIEGLKELYPTFDAIILSDYEYGLVQNTLIEALLSLRKKDPKTLVVDSKDLSKFARLLPDAVKPNYEETIKLLNLPKLQNSDRVEQVLANGRRLLEITGAKCVAATIDADGTILFEKGKNPYRLYSEPQDNRKSIGAGDTFISAMTLSISSGADYKLAAEIGSAAASVILKKEGTVVCTSNDLKDHFNENPKYIADLKDLEDKLKELKAEGKRIVFTNGCFDILHRGHVNFLNHAKAYGDVLVVGINTDESIRRVKGNERPINTLEDRIEVLSALHAVDYLISFEEDTSAELVKALSPHFFVKGGTYTIESIPEALLVKQMGGEVKIIPSTNHSTTSLIHKIRDVNFHPQQEKEYAKASGLE
jgi:D-beta-D-heptose 7-phosphate kinase / D-beta-D-heptose 1-phosphate adenosyltransferase